MSGCSTGIWQTLNTLLLFLQRPLLPFTSNSCHSFVPVCLQDVSGMSLSMLAAAGGQDDILRLLIKKGARVNGRQKNGTTALMHAAEKVALIKVDHDRLLTRNCLWIHETKHAWADLIRIDSCVFVFWMINRTASWHYGYPSDEGFLFAWNLISLIPHMCRRPRFLKEFLDNSCHPAGGRFMCQCSDPRWGNCADEGNGAFSHSLFGCTEWACADARRRNLLNKHV